MGLIKLIFGNTVDRIREALSDRELSAKELAHELGKTKKQINEILYKHKDEYFHAEGDTPPTWSLIEDVDRIREALCDRELSAKELAHELGKTKKQINEILYKHEDEYFHAEGDTPPIWSLIEEDYEEEEEEEDYEPIDLGVEAREWQKRAISDWKANGYQGIVEAVTGTGKTMLALMAIKEALEEDEGNEIVIVVPTIVLQNQWFHQLKEKLKRWTIGRMGGGHQDTLEDCHVLVAVAASAGNKYYNRNEKEYIGLLIADEAHRYTGEIWGQALQPEFERRLGLTATFEPKDKSEEDELLNYFKKVVHSYSYKEAIREGVIAKFKLAMVGVQFSPRERDQYDGLSKKINNAVRNLVKKHEAPQPFEKPGSFGKFMKHITSLQKNGTMKEGIAAQRFLGPFAARRKLLSGSKAKLKILKKLAKAIKVSNGTILFTESIDSANDSAKILKRKHISCESMHSKMNQTERAALLERFRQKKITAVVAPKILDEGVDVPEVDLGIIIAASKQKRQMIQRMGRVLRLKQDERHAKFIITYVQGTSEDPQKGAHEAFLEQIEPVANEVENFNEKSSGRDIANFLS